MLRLSVPRLLTPLLCLPLLVACGSSDSTSSAPPNAQPGLDASADSSPADDGALPDAVASDTGPDAPADSSPAGDGALDASADVLGDDVVQQDASADGEADDASPQDAATEHDSAPPNLDPDCTRLVVFDGQLASSASDAERVAVVEQFVFDVAASDGFPIRCGSMATFLFDRPQGFGAPSVVGDFNSWDAAAAQMAPVVGDWFRVQIAIDPGPNRYLYKLTDGQSWVADPNARRFGYDAYGEYSLVSGGLTRGHLERFRGVAGAGLAPRDLTVYLPPGYEASTDDYPVLYAHDGQNLFDPNAMWGGWKLDTAIEDLLSQGGVRPFVVVGIHNTAERMDEYTHVPDVFSGQTVGGKGDAYFSLIQTRVMPLVASHYRIQTGPDNTWTMGSSLGGLISLYFGMKHPDVFGRVAGLSSTAGWGSIGGHNQTIIELLPTLSHPSAVFYLDSGGSDGGPPGCVDTDQDGIEDDAPAADDSYCENIQMRDVFEAQGYVEGTDVFHWWEPGAEHNEAAWAARVDRPLEVLAAP